MKILAVVVFYHPDGNARENVYRLKQCHLFDTVFVIDNSEKEEELNDKEIVYSSFHENKGIASALKKGMEYALANNFDYVLTLDQDSLFPFEKEEEILKYLEKYHQDNVGIVSLNYNGKYKSKSGVKEIKQQISSGNFINVNAYKEIEGFNENLFIDYVDFDLCHQFYKAKKKVLVLCDISLIHTIGNPIYKRILFIKLKSMNPQPIRYYYLFRNMTYLHALDKRFYRKNYFKERMTLFISSLCDKDYKIKKEMAKRGISDGKKGILGKYKEDNL